MRKNYVLDTNILLSSPNAIFGFEDNDVFITSTTLQELDDKKTAGGEVGYCARQTGRILENLMQKGNLVDGMEIDTANGNKGVFRVLASDTDGEYIAKSGYKNDRPDMYIINTCLNLATTVNEPVILVSNDTMMRIMAQTCGLESQAYRNEHVDEKEAYTGIRDVELKDYSLIEDIHKFGRIGCVYEIKHPEENEFFRLNSGNTHALAVYRNGVYTNISNPQAMHVKPFNSFQKFALTALLAPPEDIPLVILKGPAGTAKTLLSLAAGLEHTYNDKKESRYKQIYITRANHLADGDFGYLPGDLAEKMQELLNPFYDNLEIILSGDSHEEPSVIREQIDDLFDCGFIQLLPLAYIRGRSLPKSYIIVDEAQNCSPRLMRDIVTRIGTGSKLVVLGDPSQCDNHALDSKSNGLVWLAEKMRGSMLCAQVTADESVSVRSPLASEALNRL